MSTNYYLKTAIMKACPHCGEEVEVGKEELHIGKSSIGWAFTLHTHPDKGLKNVTDWTRKILATAPGEIVDEYETIITPANMLSTIYRAHMSDEQISILSHCSSSAGCTKWCDYLNSDFS